MNATQKQHASAIQRYKDTAYTGELIDAIAQEKQALAAFKNALAAVPHPKLSSLETAVQLVKEIVAEIENWIRETEKLIGVADDQSAQYKLRLDYDFSDVDLAQIRQEYPLLKFAPVTPINPQTNRYNLIATGTKAAFFALLVECHGREHVQAHMDDLILI